jgi:hypothetical protein
MRKILQYAQLVAILAFVDGLAFGAEMTAFACLILAWMISLFFFFEPEAKDPEKIGAWQSARDRPSGGAR